EYSKAATQGSWHGADGVWTEFDRMMARRDMSLVAG
ncbi:MAG: ribonucleoside-diphosphate reductase beta chain, partial [Brevundimonas sp.]